MRLKSGPAKNNKKDKNILLEEKRRPIMKKAVVATVAVKAAAVRLCRRGVGTAFSYCVTTSMMEMKKGIGHRVHWTKKGQQQAKAALV